MIIYAYNIIARKFPNMVESTVKVCNIKLSAFIILPLGLSIAITLHMCTYTEGNVLFMILILQIFSCVITKHA